MSAATVERQKLAIARFQGGDRQRLTVSVAGVSIAGQSEVTKENYKKIYKCVVSSYNSNNNAVSELNSNRTNKQTPLT